MITDFKHIILQMLCIQANTLVSGQPGVTGWHLFSPEWWVSRMLNYYKNDVRFPLNLLSELGFHMIELTLSFYRNSIRIDSTMLEVSKSSTGRT